MSTEAQIQANRRNCQKSTGPRTPKGKAIVSRNALKHGLLARHNVIFSLSKWGLIWLPRCWPERFARSRMRFGSRKILHLSNLAQSASCLAGR